MLPPGLVSSANLLRKHSIPSSRSLIKILNKAGQAGPAFHEPILAGPDSLVVLHMPGEHTQDELLLNLPQPRGQADRPVVLQVLLLALLVDGRHVGSSVLAPEGRFGFGGFSYVQPPWVQSRPLKM